MTDNWKKPFITDILVNTVNFCPDGYEDLYSETWAGTDEGCVCSGFIFVIN